MKWPWSKDIKAPPEPQPLYRLVLEDVCKIFPKAPPVTLLAAMTSACDRIQEYADYHPGACVPTLDTFGSIIKRIPYHYCIDWNVAREEAAKGPQRQTTPTIPLYDVID